MTAPTLQESRGTPVHSAMPLDASRPAARRIRILHSVGHLLRGGIESWLYQVVTRLDPALFENHILVRTEQKEAFTDAFIAVGAKVLSCVGYTNPIRYAKNLRRVVRTNGPYDILHVHGSNPSGLQACILAKHLGIPSTTVHSHNDVRPLLRSRGNLYRVYVRLTMTLLRKYADSGLAASNLAAESMFGEQWQQNPKWQILFCGIDLTPFSQSQETGLRKKLNIPAEAFVIGHVGRFHEQKNHSFLIEIAKAAVQRNPKSHFLFIGEGELRSQITARFQQPDLVGHATFVPDTPDVAKFLQIMDCFVFPSRYEGLGLVAVEAQAAGLSCFLSDRVPSEAIVNPKIVRVLRLEDPASQWADEILNRTTPTKTRATQEQLELVENSNFNIDRSTARLATHYRALMGAKA